MVPEKFKYQIYVDGEPVTEDSLIQFEWVDAVDEDRSGFEVAFEASNITVTLDDVSRDVSELVKKISEGFWEKWLEQQISNRKDLIIANWARKELYDLAPSVPVLASHHKDENYFLPLYEMEEILAVIKESKC